MGERLGRYMVLKHLASGGMADVLLARTDGIEGFERHVVLKRIRAEHAKDQRFIDMFLDEARLAANLHHQNIVQVHDIGEANGEYFFAMEYIHGEDLRAMLSIVSKTRTHMPLGTVVSVISSVAAGLHYAHERRGADKKPLNIVHRDVSPSNIIVGYDGSVKIVDFGIAKAAMRQVETRSGSLKGKVSYMSPEHCKVSPIDRRSDVYSLGVVLYELATTTRLFKSDSDYLVMDAICTGKIPLPRVRRPDLPNELSTIIMTALATEPDRRYQTAEELRVALDAFAVKANLTASAGTIASYVHKLCGERAEPWLEGAAATDQKPVAYAETLAGDNDAARRSWTELPRDEEAAGTVADKPSAEAKTITDGKGKRRTPATPLPVAAAADPTNTKLGWENKGTVPPARRFGPAKIAMIFVPLVAIAGVLAFTLMTRGSESVGERPVAAITAVPSTQPTRANDKEPASPTAAIPAAGSGSAMAAVPATADKPLAGRDLGFGPTDPTTGASAEAAKPKATKPVDSKVAATTTKPADPKVAATTKPADPKIAATTTKPADPNVATTTKPADPKGAATTTKPADPKAVVTTTKPADPKVVATTTKPGDPKPVEPAKVVPPVAPPPPPPPPPSTEPAVVPAGVVEKLASKHRKALLACEGTETLHGDVTVKFWLNAEGAVVRSQVHSTLNKIKVSNCILLAVRTWQFPKPATGTAIGTYSISFQ